MYDPLPGRNAHALDNFIMRGRNNENKNIDPSLNGVDFSGAHVSVWPNHSLHIGAISGAVFSGFAATLLANKHSNNISTITKQDFAVALSLAYVGRDPAFSLDPWEPTKPDGPWLRCVYYPEQISIEWKNFSFSLAQTDYGRTMFEADWLLKQLSMGVNLDGYIATGPFPSLHCPFEYHSTPDLFQLGLRDRFELENSHRSSSSTDSNPRYTRLWITVNQEKTLEGLVPPYETFSASLMSCSQQTDLGNSIAIHFSDVKLGVQVMRMARSVSGELEDISDPRLSDPNSSDVIFARLMTDHYDEIAQHYPSLRRLRELAKLQAIAKWMLENDVHVDIDEVLKCISESAVVAIEKVPALERHSNNIRLFGGVNLTIRQNHHDRAPDYTTLGKQIQIELKNIVRQSIHPTTADKMGSVVLPLPFVKRKHCSVCDRPIDFASLFKPSISSNDVPYCNEHHPDACYQCMLPLYVDPISGIQTSENVFLVIQEGDSKLRFHRACFLCGVCDTPIADQSYAKDPDVLYVYYHVDCYSPIQSHNQMNTHRTDDIGISKDDEQAQLEMVLRQSKEEYEYQQKASRSTDYSISHRHSHSSLKHQSQDTLKNHDYYQNEVPISLTSEDEETQLAMALQLSLQTYQSKYTIDTNNELPEYMYDSITPIAIKEHFSCQYCGNNFKTWTDLEDHTQLHFDN